MTTPVTSRCTRRRMPSTATTTRRSMAEVAQWQVRRTRDDVTSIMAALTSCCCFLLQSRSCNRIGISTWATYNSLNDSAFSSPMTAVVSFNSLPSTLQTHRSPPPYFKFPRQHLKSCTCVLSDESTVHLEIRFGQKPNLSPNALCKRIPGSDMTSVLEVVCDRQLYGRCAVSSLICDVLFWFGQPFAFINSFY